MKQNEPVEEFIKRYVEKSSYVVFGGDEKSQTDQNITMFIHNLTPKLALELNKVRDQLSSLSQAEKLCIRLERLNARV